MALRQTQAIRTRAPSQGLTDIVNAACWALEIYADGIKLNSDSMHAGDGTVPRNSNGFYIVKTIQDACIAGKFNAANFTDITEDEFRAADKAVIRSIAQEIEKKFDADLRQRFILPQTKTPSDVIVERIVRAFTV